MRVKSFTVEGPLPTEIPSLQEIEKAFPADWLGFANVIVRHPTKARSEREIDLIVVTHDRVIMIDLKHWKGRLELVDGYWHQNGHRRDTSPVEKMRANVNLLMKVFEVESFKLGKPRVEGLVVLTHPQCDTSLLGSDAKAVMRIGDFMRLAEPGRYKTFFNLRTAHSDNPLNAGNSKTEILRFFTPGRVFEPRKTRFASYEAVDALPEFTNGLFSEYLARDIGMPAVTALLKVWDFTGDEELRHAPERKDLLDRERAVLGYLSDRDPELAQVALRPRERDPELGPRHWELFDRDRHLQRLSRFANDAAAELDPGSCIELAKVLSGYVAGLHRAEVAHRDLGAHSIWVDPARLRVSLSSFGAARFPERRSVGLLRAKLLGAGLTLPEDTGVVEQGSAYQQDVFLLALAIWRLLAREPFPSEPRVPDWSTLPEEAKAGISEPLRAWFARCLDWNPSARFPDGVEAHDAFLAALRADEGRGLGAVDLSSYEAEVDPTIDYPPKSMIERTRCRIYTTEVEGETLLVKNWPERLIGDRGRNAAKLIEFFGRADRLRSSSGLRLPKVKLACLSQDGLFLLQNYSVGETLESTDVAAWSFETYRRFLLDLAEAVVEAHELGIAHGDLSPRNVLVTPGNEPRARIIDFLDFSTESAGERVTLAYAPVEGAADPYVRDRFAVARIADEIASKATALTGAEFAAVSKAADACGDPDAPWATLTPLIDMLGQGRTTVPAEGLSLAIGFPRCQAPGSMLADDGLYHVVLIRQTNEINVVGFDCQLTMAFDPSSRSIRSVRQAKAQALGWAISNKAFSFPGSIELYQSAQVSVDGLEGLLANDAITAWLGASAGTEAASVAPTADKPTTTRPPVFPTARFWEEQILAEENT